MNPFKAGFERRIRRLAERAKKNVTKSELPTRIKVEILREQRELAKNLDDPMSTYADLPGDVGSL